jgi:hypothetical protein
LCCFKRCKKHCALVRNYQCSYRGHNHEAEASGKRKASGAAATGKGRKRKNDSTRNGPAAKRSRASAVEHVEPTVAKRIDVKRQCKTAIGKLSVEKIKEQLELRGRTANGKKEQLVTQLVAAVQEELDNGTTGDATPPASKAPRRAPPTKAAGKAAASESTDEESPYESSSGEDSVGEQGKDEEGAGKNCQTHKQSRPGPMFHGSNPLCTPRNAVADDDRKRINLTAGTFVDALPVESVNIDSLEKEAVLVNWGDDYGWLLGEVTGPPGDPDEVDDDGNPINWYVHYKVDNEETPHSFRVNNYSTHAETICWSWCVLRSVDST